MSPQFNYRRIVWEGWSVLHLSPAATLAAFCTFPSTILRVQPVLCESENSHPSARLILFLLSVWQPSRAPANLSRRWVCVGTGNSVRVRIVCVYSIPVGGVHNVLTACCM